VSARSKTPTSKGQAPPPFTDENKKTGVYDPNKHAKKSGGQYAEPDPTVVDGPLGGAKMHDKPAPNAGPTVLEKPRPPVVAVSKKERSAPIVAVSKKEQSAPIQAISMKTPNDQKAAAAPDKTPMLARPKLRAVSEVMPAQTPQNLGNLAQPYNPKEARSRAMREYVIWGCVAVMLASAIALVVWFAAR